MARDDSKRKKKPFIVGVAGGTASGKSLVTKKIIERLGFGPEQGNNHVNRIALESFYRELSPAEQIMAQRGDYDFDHPSAFEFDKLIETIERLTKGEVVDIPVYDFIENKNNGSVRIECPEVLIVEGILIFYDKRLRDLFGMKLFVDADADIRLARRVRRDTVERRRPLNAVLHQYMGKVKPAFEEFCLPTKKYADVIIPRGGENDVAVDLIVQHINDILRSPRVTPVTSASNNCLDDEDSLSGDFSSSGRGSRRGGRSLTSRPH